MHLARLAERWRHMVHYRTEHMKMANTRSPGERLCESPNHVAALQLPGKVGGGKDHRGIMPVRVVQDATFLELGKYVTMVLLTTLAACSSKNLCVTHLRVRRQKVGESRLLARDAARVQAPNANRDSTGSKAPQAPKMSAGCHEVLRPFHTKQRRYRKICNVTAGSRRVMLR